MSLARANSVVLDVDESAVDQQIIGKHMREICQSSSASIPLKTEDAPRSKLVAIHPPKEHDAVCFKASASLQKFMLRAEPVPANCLHLVLCLRPCCIFEQLVHFIR